MLVEFDIPGIQHAAEDDVGTMRHDKVEDLLLCVVRFERGDGFCRYRSILDEFVDGQ